MNRRLFVRGAAIAGAGVVALTATGCLPARRGSFDAPDVLDATLADARSLVAAYDAALAADSPARESLEMIRANHAEHAATLSRMLGADETIVEVAHESMEALSDLERSAADAAVEACVAAETRYAVLLGEIAAGRRCHVAVLKAIG